jgi:hypothetical protein
VRLCGCAAVRLCGCAAVRLCGCAAVRLCGCAADKDNVFFRYVIKKLFTAFSNYLSLNRCKVKKYFLIING